MPLQRAGHRRDCLQGLVQGHASFAGRHIPGATPEEDVHVEHTAEVVGNAFVGGQAGAFDEIGIGMGEGREDVTRLAFRRCMQPECQS